MIFTDFVSDITILLRKIWYQFIKFTLENTGKIIILNVIEVAFNLILLTNCSKTNFKFQF